ncbi:hypothetical protein Hanom_Chr04g00284081 [Helianthus anomalus]
MQTELKNTQYTKIQRFKAQIYYFQKVCYKKMKPEDALKLSEYPHLCSICVLLKQFAASAFIYQTLSIPYKEPIGLEYEPTKKQKPRKTFSLS